MHRLPILRDGLPVQYSEVQSETKKVHKCTLCSDRVGVGLEPACIKACPTGCLHFGSKDDMKDLAEKRVPQLARAHLAHQRGRVRSGRSRRDARHLRAARHRSSRELGGLPKDPRVPWTVAFWKGPLKWLGNLAMTAGIIGVTPHYCASAPRKLSRRGSSLGKLVASEHHCRGSEAREHAGVIERYTFRERIMHWLTGGTYLYCLATGLAFYSPHLYWLAYVLGGAPTSRFWHPIWVWASSWAPCG